MLDIKIIRNEKLKQKPKSSELTFGTTFTDHMFVMDYDKAIGWHDAKIMPYGPLEMEPSTMVLHYAQEVFEGMKAYKNEDDILLFRPYENARRMNNSSERICIPTIPEEDFVQAVKKIVEYEKDWIPEGEGTSLYIRPFIYAADPFVGVRPAEKYKFIIILSPVGAYYKEGLNPVKIWVEDKYVRATPGGIGEAKTGGNYAASIKAQMESKEKGYTQVLWLDGVERKYVEEVGTMNVAFKINGKIVTPSLSGSILPGITRKSVIELTKSWGMEVVEERISIEELMEYGRKGELEEAFGTGTAAVISPIGELCYKGEKIVINNGKTGETSKRIYNELTGIQLGEVEDKFGWTIRV